MSFEIERRDDVCVLRIGGRSASDPDANYLRMKAREIKSLGCRKLIADIRELDSIGSSGIGFFVELYTSATKDTAGRFVLVGASLHVLEVLNITRLNTIIPMAEDLAAGLAFCAREDEKARRAAGSPR
jgi:anti-anti-sigma factor